MLLHVTVPEEFMRGGKWRSYSKMTIHDLQPLRRNLRQEIAQKSRINSFVPARTSWIDVSKSTYILIVVLQHRNAALRPFNMLQTSNCWELPLAAELCKPGKALE